MGQNVHLASGSVMDIGPSTGVTTTVTSAWFYKDRPNSTIQCSVVGTGSVAATVIIEVSNDKINVCATPAGTFTFSSAASPQSDGFVIGAPWKYVRYRITAISGTNATVNVNICG